MYCPKCAAQAVEGQRFCRNCGVSLGVILDAMENRRAPIDFETLKRDLRDLGASLRTGFEGAQDALKITKRLQSPHPGAQPAPSFPASAMSIAELSREMKKAVKKINAADSRKLSLQKATLSLFGGGAYMFVWYQVLLEATRPEVLDKIEEIIAQANPQMAGIDLDPFAGLIRILWLLGMIPLAKGVAYLINGIFLVPKPEPEPAPQIIYSTPQTPAAYVSAVADSATNEFENRAVPQPPESITEDATLRFEPKETS